jgi:carbonic anhydrase
MDRRHALLSLAGLAVCPFCARTAGAEGAHWSYEGDSGPAKWSDIDAASRVCGIGGQQSPIDIRAAVKSQLPPLKIEWQTAGADTIVNNGHTIQINFNPGSRLGLGDVKYNLVQLHFHRPSEHLIGGRNFPMEAHFVHRAESGGLAVVGVLLTHGKPNAAFNHMVTTMPAQEGPPVKLAAPIDPNALLPARRNYFRYSGSLTTPPCSEVVEWLVLGDPLQVAEPDVERFGKVYAMNARPPQPLNRRFVLQSG